MTLEQSLIKQYSDIPFSEVDNRILLVFLNRSGAQADSDRRYVVQVAVNVLGKEKQGSKQDYLSLVQDTFSELKGQSRDQISFLLPRLPEASTRLDFDENATWYRLGDSMFDQLTKPPRILGVQCKSLFKTPRKSLMDEVAGIIPILIAPIIMVVVCLAMSLGKK